MFGFSSKKALLNQIKSLQAEVQKGKQYEMHFQHMEDMKNRKIWNLQSELRQLKGQLAVYKKKYADELQLRLELVEIVEKMENKRGDNNENKT